MTGERRGEGDGQGGGGVCDLPLLQNLLKNELSLKVGSFESYDLSFLALVLSSVGVAARLLGEGEGGPLRKVDIPSLRMSDEGGGGEAW